MGETVFGTRLVFGTMGETVFGTMGEAVFGTIFGAMGGTVFGTRFGRGVGSRGHASCWSVVVSRCALSSSECSRSCALSAASGSPET